MLGGVTELEELLAHDVVDGEGRLAGVMILDVADG
jgi:hypothetical protein